MNVRNVFYDIHYNKKFILIRKLRHFSIKGHSEVDITSNSKFSYKICKKVNHATSNYWYHGKTQCYYC